MLKEGRRKERNFRLSVSHGKKKRKKNPRKLKLKRVQGMVSTRSALSDVPPRPSFFFLFFLSSSQERFSYPLFCFAPLNSEIWVILAFEREQERVGFLYLYIVDRTSRWKARYAVCYVSFVYFRPLVTCRKYLFISSCSRVWG